MRTAPVGGLLLLLSSVFLGGCQSDVARERAAASRGGTVAQAWCAECHRVSPDQPSGARAGHTMPPPLVAPSFMTIADGPDGNRERLQRFVSGLHLPMPTFRLSHDEQQDVVAYILSLKRGS